MLSQETVYLILAISLIVLLGSAKRWEPLHPIVWYPIFIVLYHYSPVILNKLSIYNLTHPLEVSKFAFMSVLTYGITILLLESLLKEKYEFRLSTYVGLKTALKLSYMFLITACITVLIFVMAGNYSSKAQTIKAGVNKFNAFYGILNTVSLLYITHMWRQGKKAIGIVTTSTVIFVGCVLVLGQRDLLFRYAIGVSIVSLIHGYIKRTHILLFGATLISIIPLTSQLKALLLSGSLRDLDQGITIAILDKEFNSAGSNLDILLREEARWTYRYGATLISDILTGIVPSQIYEIENPTTWFRYTMFPQRAAMGRGKGFGLLAEGYLNFGYIGVFLWSSIAAFINYIPYYKRLYSLSSVVVFASLVPLSIYSIRADLANIISPMVKQVIVPIVIVWITAYILRSAVN